MLLVFLLAFQFAFANETLFNYGFEGIKLDGPGQEKCFSFVTDYTNKEMVEKDGILSLKAEFNGKSADNSYASVKINGKEKRIWPEFFSCGDVCWARVFVPSLKYTPTSIEVCLHSGGSTPSAQIFSNSTIGLYTSPVIQVENSAPEEIFLGQRAEMKTTIKNNGSKDAEIFVQFVGEDTRAVIEISSFDIVEGDPQATAIIKAGEKRDFYYYIKPSLTSSYNLPSSVLSFDNIFGEKQRIVSNHPPLNVLDPEQASIIIIGEGLEDNKFKFKVKIKNSWGELFKGELKIMPEDLVKNSTISVSVPGKGEKEVNFVSNELSPGIYSISATLADSNSSKATKSISFEVKKTDFFFEIILALVGVIIAGIIFGIIYFWKS